MVQRKVFPFLAFFWGAGLTEFKPFKMNTSKLFEQGLKYQNQYRPRSFLSSQSKISIESYRQYQQHWPHYMICRAQGTSTSTMLYVMYMGIE